MPDRISCRLALAAVLFTSLTGGAFAASLPASAPLVRGAVDDRVTVTLARDRPGALAASRDLGALSAGMVLPHIRLAMKRSPENQAAFDRLTHDQLVRGSADYHRWLQPTDLRKYGPAQADINRVTGWLTGHGLTVNGVSPSGMSIDFSGTARTVGAAFHTSLHQVLFAGEAHIANVSAPAIPAALAPVVTGVTLSNFLPKPQMQRVVKNFTIPTPNGTYLAVTPSDFATIYNIKPLRASNNQYGAPITGAGVTLALVEQTQILPADWQTFRKAFGLSGYSGTLTQVHPHGCASPGFTGDEGEAALDTEWSSAVAPAANIIEASCAGSGPFGFGVLNALQNLVEYGTPATIFSISYGGDERGNGFTFESAWTNVVEEGAAEGKAIFVSAGDSGVSADRGSIDSEGLFVNGLADTPYNVSVGGTDFYDTALGQNAKYWNQTNNNVFGSAVSYIPEIPWNASCASSIIVSYLKAAGPIQLCNSSAANFVNGIGGSGSQSIYYAKPDWQLTSVLGVPNDGVRDQPDVSLFAASGTWGHFYVFCMSDANEGGSPCNYKNLNDTFGNAAGGTSFGSPAFAGIAALIQNLNDLTHGQITPLGNPAPAMYALAKAQFTTPLGLSKCNSTLGNAASTGCAFYYVTAGDNAQPCHTGTLNCYGHGATNGIGVLGTYVDGKGLLAYPAQTGYSLATGLGTVNITNLVYGYTIGT